GYRVAYGDAAHNILVLEGVRRIPVSCAPELQERVQSGSGRRAFCAIPPTSSSDLYKPGMIIMEKPEDSSNVHDYLLLETVGTKTLQKELNEARGWRKKSRQRAGAPLPARFPEPCSQLRGRLACLAWRLMRPASPGRKKKIHNPLPLPTGSSGLHAWGHSRKNWLKPLARASVV